MTGMESTSLPARAAHSDGIACSRHAPPRAAGAPIDQANTLGWIAFHAAIVPGIDPGRQVEGRGIPP